MALPEIDPRDTITEYALKVVSGEIVAGPLVRATCRRHLHDLEHGPARGLEWNLEKALHIIGYFPATLRLADGEHANKPFHLQLWQQFVVGSLFGWLGPDGFRRFRTAFIEIGKGNGKSPMVAGIGMYGLTSDNEPGAEIYAGAAKLDQARVLFRDAKNMVSLSPALSKRLTVHIANIAYIKTNSFFRPISSEKKGISGPRPHMGLLDEIHEHHDATVVDMIRAGTKGRRQALIIEITNSGFDKTTVCWAHHEYTERILAPFMDGANPDLKGYEQNDTWFGYICSLDKNDDWMKDESCWPKANPNLGVSITMKYLREQVEEARGMPSKQSIVARLNFCQWVGAENPWISREMWESVQGQFDIDDCVGLECNGALDLSSRKDLTALALVWKVKKHPKIRYRAALWYWSPADTLQERMKMDKVPYDVWEREGWISATPGNIVDYGHVAATIGSLHGKFEIQRLGFDPWRINLFQGELDDQGIDLPLIPHGQGFAKAKGESDAEPLWMPKSVEELEQAILKGELEILENPVLHWNSASAVLVADPANNRKFDKRKATGRIDGIVALAMAFGVATSDADTGWSAYQFHDFMEVGG